MQEEHDTSTNGDHNLSERFGNERYIASESFGNVRKEEGVSFGKLPNASERNDHLLRKASEPFRSNTSPASEAIDEILSRPERLPAHTLTAREVEKLFEQAGRPVTERSILNWCKPNSEGLCRLNCGYERGERRWYIAPDSVERVIEEERRRDQSFPKESLEFSEASDRLSESFGKEGVFASESFGNVRKEEGVSFGKLPNASERNTQSFPKASETHQASPPNSEAVTRPLEVERSQSAEVSKKERDELQKRVVELEREAAAGQYKDELITTLRERMNEDRQDYNERMKFFQNQVEKLQTTTERYVEDLIGINRRVGTLEAENRMLRQLPAGKLEDRDVDDDNPPRHVERPRDAFEPVREPKVVHDQPINNQPPYHV